MVPAVSIFTQSTGTSTIHGPAELELTSHEDAFSFEELDLEKTSLTPFTSNDNDVDAEASSFSSHTKKIEVSAEGQTVPFSLRVADGDGSLLEAGELGGADPPVAKKHQTVAPKVGREVLDVSGSGRCPRFSVFGTGNLHATERAGIECFGTIFTRRSSTRRESDFSRAQGYHVV